jgi:hypothetical protein
LREQRVEHFTDDALARLGQQADAFELLLQLGCGAALVGLGLRYLGTEGADGPHYKAGELGGNTVAKTNQNGTTTIDPGKIEDEIEGAMAISHEAVHDLDAKDRGRKAMNKEEVRATETNAYATEAVVGKGLGVGISKEEQARAVEGSVSNWESRQKLPEPRA